LEFLLDFLQTLFAVGVGELTPEQLGYAQAVLAAGQAMGITPLGIQIAFAVAAAESSWLMYANSNDPASLSFPHDAVGNDGTSDGLFQQQDSWGSTQCRMDPTCSANLFFTALQQTAYNSGQNSPGYYAQQVQRSADSTGSIYDNQMPAAVALYNQLIGSQRTAPAPEDQSRAVASTRRAKPNGRRKRPRRSSGQA
jgi:hypothetical protein